MNCYHIKDWLSNSRVIEENTIKQFYKHKELKICRDMCNGAKHLKLDNRASFGTNTNQAMGDGVTLHRTYDHFASSKTLNPIKNQNYVIAVDFETFNVFEVTDKCMALWKEFLKENKLL